MDKKQELKDFIKNTNTFVIEVFYKQFEWSNELDKYIEGNFEKYEQGFTLLKNEYGELFAKFEGSMEDIQFTNLEQIIKYGDNNEYEFEILDTYVHRDGGRFGSKCQVYNK